MEHRTGEAAKPIALGRRKVRPRVCIADGKRHIRVFLREALEELGFITCECAQLSQLDAVLDEQLPDLVLLGLSAGGVEAGETLKALAAREFDGKLLLLGPRDSFALRTLQELGHTFGVTMLPELSTPFGIGGLRDRVATLLPSKLPPSPAVDVVEAASAGWLELWHQPKIDTRTLLLCGAEALIRIRHPTWGVISPAYFIPDDGDPHLRALSEFVIGQVVDDWRYFADQHGHIEMAINLPIAFLQHPESLESLCQQMPDHPAFEGLIVEINGTEVIRNLELVKDIARQLRFHKIAISIDDLGVEWPSLIGLRDFPFVEFKIDRKFVTGCADDRLKQAVCHRILKLADDCGARTVAEGVETVADFLAVREMGFDLAQGFLFAKPMPARKFARTALSQPVTMTTT
jgi:EAL domain-containing protein (putative c-di-GMP-specific phosphodiesterase class I)/CheY-like chemotaxis protein